VPEVHRNETSLSGDCQRQANAGLINGEELFQVDGSLSNMYFIGMDGPSLDASSYRTADQKLGDFFDPARPRTSFSDLDFLRISTALQACDRRAWSLVPRLYTVLRIIGRLDALDKFIDEGITDVWFPFTNNRLPRALGSSMQAAFLDTQELVYTKGLSLETGGEKKHAHFSSGEKLPFRVLGVLGEGGYGQVQKITSLISQQTFARKEFRRGDSSAIKSEVKSFLLELQILKRLHHRHCVELVSVLTMRWQRLIKRHKVASYTDARHFAIIMSPVADYNLLQYYKVVGDDPEKKTALRRFFGCLADGLAYLHSEKIRHRDIKPQNILVKGDRVFLTDFGISLDWASLSRSTTEDDHAKTWMYCAPEVAENEPKNTLSDVWSLGCVYLEMTTILKGSSLDEMGHHFKGAGQQSYRYYNAGGKIATWSAALRKQGLDWDNLALDWVASMLHRTVSHRISAATLAESIKDIRLFHSGCPVSFCGDCCEKLEEDLGEWEADEDVWNESNSKSSNAEIQAGSGPMSMDPQVLVIAIDFGATFSAVACGTSVDQSWIMQTWPGQYGQINSDEVPTELRYTNEGIEWGFRIPPNVVRHQWFKL